MTTLIAPGDTADMQPDRFVMVDPGTDQVLWACSGPTVEGRCPVAEQPPYVCQGLRLVPAQVADQDGQSFIVERTVPGRCPLADRRAAGLR